MERLDRWSALFWLAVSVAISVHSLNLGFGSFREPGVGFLFFWCGVVLGALSLVLFIQAHLERKKSEKGLQGRLFGEIRWLSVGAVLLGLLVYALIFESFGALLSTAVFIAFLMRTIGNKRWPIVLVVALSSTLSIYLLFKVILNVRLPAGFLGL